MQENEAQLTLEPGSWRQTAASIQDPELQSTTPRIWEEEILANSSLSFKKLPQREEMLLPVRGREPGFGAFPAQRGLVFVPPTFQIGSAALGWGLSMCKLLPGVKIGKRWFFLCFLVC